MDRLKDSRFAKFHKAFIEEIAPQYKYYETKRREFLKEMLHVFYLINIVGLVIIIIVAIIATKKIEEMIAITLFFGTILVFWSLIINIRQSVLEYKVFLKQEIMPHFLNIFGDIQWVNCKATGNNVSFLDEDKELSPDEFSEIQNGGLFLGDQGIPDDKFFGTYKDVNFKIYETVIKTKDNNAGMPEFKGLILLCNFNKKVKAKTIVSSKNTNNLSEDSKTSIKVFCLISAFVFMLGFSFFVLPSILSHNFHFENVRIFILCLLTTSIILGVMLNPLFSGGKIVVGNLNHVALEDSKFSTRFKVYSEDQIEGRYLVTPAFMERFYNLKTEFGNKQIRCSFYDDKFMVAIDSKKDFFEFGNIFKPVHDGLNIYQFYRQIRAIYDMIDYFKLNENIYLK